MGKTLFRKILFQHLLILLYLPLFYLFSQNLEYPLRIILGILTAFLLTILLTGELVRSLNSRLGRITASLTGIQNGNYRQLVIGERGDELSALETTVSELSIFLKEQARTHQEEEGMLAAVLSSMDEGVLVIDCSGDIVLANRKGRELFGEPLEGEPVTDKIRDPVLLKFLDQSRKDMKTVDFELEAGPGKCSFVAVSISPFLDGARVLGSVIVLYDISWLKQLESMRREFVANVSHELKTPLTAIQGFSETLLADGLRERESAIRFLKIIEGNARRMSRLVTDLLTLSNIELGKTAFEMVPVDVKEVVEEVIAALPPGAKREGVELNADFREVAPVRADREWLKQILINLFDNSLKYTEAGAISVRAVQYEKKIELSVSDTGIGIPKNKISRIGERFYRVDPARSRELGGTGLGLAIVKHLVRSMNGEFLISSDTGKGTKITITLPRY